MTDPKEIASRWLIEKGLTVHDDELDILAHEYLRADGLLTRVGLEILKGKGLAERADHWLERIQGMCGNADAAHGCYLITKYAQGCRDFLSVYTTYTGCQDPGQPVENSKPKGEI